jgi:uncharacterized protein (DUF169 family)
MNVFDSLIKRLIKALDVPNLEMPAAGVRLFKKNESVPREIAKYEPHGMTVTSCHATRATMLDEAVYLTGKSIGCIAAAISLGLVDERQPAPLDGPRDYTEIMKKSSGKGEAFVPPSPLKFTDGTVYAFKDAQEAAFALFGKEDSGRFAKKEIARNAVADMLALQPPTTQGVFYFPPDFSGAKITPDVVMLSLRPVELCRLIQGYQFLTGKRVRADVGGLRAGCSDLIVRPYVSGEINFSPYCLGARLIARFEGDRMGMGFPFSILEIIVEGTEKSKTGFPFSEYPGAHPRGKQHQTKADP